MTQKQLARTTLSFLLLALLPGCTTPVTIESADRIPAPWPEFRGPGGQGHAVATDLPTRWSEKENVVWKTALPGLGYSSPVVEGTTIWMTTATEKPATEEEIQKKLSVNTGNQPLKIVGEVTFWALGVDLVTGELEHEIRLFSRSSPDPVHDLNSFASPSPVIENGRLYCHFGTNGTACLDTRTGEVAWLNEEVDINHENGPGSTPIIYRDLLIFHCDGSDLQYILALDKKTGKRAWKTPRTGEMHSNPQLKKAYGTPIVTQIDGRDVLLSPAANWLYAYDPSSGEELWKLSYGELGFSIVPRPVLGHGKVYFSTCFMKARLLAVDLGGETPSIAWTYKRQVPHMSSPILVGDEVYIVSDKGGILTCLDAKTGESHYVERLGGNFSASPILADGKLYFSNREGKTSVIRRGQEFELLGTGELDGAHFASPIALGNALILRTDRALYRVESQP